MSNHPFFPKLEHAFSISLELTGLRWVEPTALGDKRGAVFAAAGKSKDRVSTGESFRCPVATTRS